MKEEFAPMTTAAAAAAAAAVRMNDERETDRVNTRKASVVAI